MTKSYPNLRNCFFILFIGFFIFSFNINGFGEKYFVSSTGDNGNTGLTASSPWQTVAFAISNPIVVTNDSIIVLPGTYSETNITITKSLKLFGNEISGNPGTGPKPVFNGIAPTPTSSVFIIQSANVVIKNFEIQVNQGNTMRGIFASGPGFNRVRIEDNHIFSTGSAFGSAFNSFGIQLGQPTSLATADSFLIVRNIIRPLGPFNGAFGRGIRLVGGFGKVGGETLADSNQIWGTYAIQCGDASGAIQIINNHLIGSSSALEINNPASSRIHRLEGNTLNPLPNITALSMIEIKNNRRTNSIIQIKNNKFIGHQIFGVFSTRSVNVEVRDNVFIPSDTSTIYTHIGVNNKQQTTATDAPVSCGITVTGNDFQSNALSAGRGILFQNHNSGITPPFSNVVIGGAGNLANTFSSNLKFCIGLDSASGASNRLPIWNQTGYKLTTMRPVNFNLDISQNAFNLGTGNKLPSIMTNSELLALENKIIHGIDFDSLGFVTVVPNQAFVTSTSFLFPKSTAPSIQRAHDIASSDGWSILAEPFSYPEPIAVSKTISIQSEPANAITVQALTMNGVGKTFSVNSPLTLGNSFNLTNGFVKLDGSDLTCNSTGSFSGGSQQSYVVTSGAGKLVYTGLTSARLFPLGTLTSYFPATLANSGTADDFGLSVKNDVLSSGVTGTPVDSVVGATWILNEGTQGGSNLTFTPQWAEVNEKPFFTRNLTSLQAFGTSWSTISGASGVAASGSNPYQVVFSGLNASFNNTPLRVKTFENTSSPSRLYYVDVATGLDTRTNEEAKNPNTPWKTIANALLQTAGGDSIQVFPGTYNEFDLRVTKGLTILGNVIGVGVGPGAGTGVKPIINGAGPSLIDSSIFIITAQNVNIRNFNIKVDQLNIKLGINAPKTGFGGLVIEDNLIESTRDIVGNFDVIVMSHAILLGRLIGTNVNGNDSIIVRRNVINRESATKMYFSRGIRWWGGRGMVGGNTLGDGNEVHADFAVQLAGGNTGGRIQTRNNNLFGRAAGIEYNTLAPTFRHVIANNTVQPLDGRGHFALIEMKSNIRTTGPTAPAPPFIDIENNTLINFYKIGVAITRSRNINLFNNTFTPIADSINYTHVWVNTKQRTSGTAASQPPLALIETFIQGNTFNGNNVLGGYGIAFQDANSSGNPVFTVSSIGGAGNLANTFGSNIKTVAYLDTITGPSSGDPFWSNPGINWSAWPSTNTNPVKDNFDFSENNFDVGTGSKRPAVMTAAELLQLENKISHKIESDVLGFVTVKPSNVYVTLSSFIAPLTTAPSLQRAINATNTTDGFTINIEPGVYSGNSVVTNDVTFDATPNQEVTTQGLEINGAGKTLLLNDSLRISGSLVLSQGIIDINDSDLSMDPTATLSGGSLATHVRAIGAGYFVHTGLGATPRKYPIGTATRYVEVELSNTGTVDNLGIKLKDDVLSNGLTGTPVDSVVGITYQLKEEVSGASNLNFKATWGEFDEKPFFDRSKAYIQQFNGVWSNVSGSASIAASGSNPYTIQAPISGSWNGEAIRISSPNFNLTSIVTQSIIKIGPRVSGKYCLGDSLKIPFTVTGTAIIPGNVFNAFLSNPDGTFPINGGTIIGSLSGSTSDTIIGVIPASTPLGLNYRIRVQSSAPEITGDPNPDSIKVFGLPARPVITGDSALCSGETSVLTSSLSTTYVWFPGGQITQNINVTTPGSYSVRIFDENRCKNTSAVRNVTISPSPVAEPITVTGSLIRCDGDSIELTANPPGLTYSWLNQVPAVTSRNFFAKASGSYSVIVTNLSGCSDTSTAVSATFNPNPAKPVVASPNANICQPGSLVFETAAGFTYNWSITSITPNPTSNTVSITDPGIYTAIVNITDVNGCKNVSDPFIGTLRKAPVSPAIVALNGSFTVCQGTNIQLQANPFTATNTYTWQPGNVQTPTLALSNPGSFTVTLLVDSNGCTSPASAAVTAVVNPKPATPVATLTGSNSICPGQSATLSSSVGSTYVWSPGGQTSQDIQVSTTGNYSVVVSNPEGCLSDPSNSININLKPIPANPLISSSAAEFCEGTSVTISVTNQGAGVTYSWNNSLTGPQITVNNTATVTATANLDGCTSISDPLTVTRNLLPIPVITADNNDFRVCLGDSVILNSNFETGNRWSGGTPATAQRVVYKSSVPAITLEVTDAKGCKNTAGPVQVIIDPLPRVALLKDSAIVLGENVELTAINFPANTRSYDWYNEDVLEFTGTSPIQLVSPQRTAEYFVVLTDSNGCKATDSVLIRVSSEVYVPNLFSPNKDGKNDIFKVYGFGVQSIEFKIWDRLGNLIYETNKVEDIVETSESVDTVKGWDGTYKGKELGQESYIWSLTGKSTTGEDLKVRGGKKSGAVILMN